MSHPPTIQTHTFEKKAWPHAPRRNQTSPTTPHSARAKSSNRSSSDLLHLVFLARVRVHGALLLSILLPVQNKEASAPWRFVFGDGAKLAGWQSGLALTGGCCEQKARLLALGENRKRFGVHRHLRVDRRIRRQRRDTCTGFTAQIPERTSRYLLTFLDVGTSPSMIPAAKAPAAAPLTRSAGLCAAMVADGLAVRSFG